MGYFNELLRDKLDKLTCEFSEDAILTEIGYDTIACYIKSRNNVDLGRCIGNDEDAIKMIKGVCKYLAHHRYLDKEDMKKELCDFIDFWF